jgi:malonyl CoA-acyl carrier protein transacylase
MTKAVIFPGQGSQEIGMGRVLFEKYAEHIAIANKIIGRDICKICLDGPEEDLNNTANAQAAIYLCNALSYMEWRESNNRPDYVLGHSIGQYNAMLAAKMISFEEGLRLVKLRGDLMGQQNGGAMAAVMKISSIELIDALAGHKLGSQVDIANYNSEYQTVISLEETIINDVLEYLKSKDAFPVRLRTSGAFHSRHMQAVKTTFEQTLQEINFSTASTKLICNLTADYIKNPKASLAEHLVSPVKWSQSIYKILEVNPNAEFYECGWGKTLSNILRFNKREFLQKHMK